MTRRFPGWVVAALAALAVVGSPIAAGAVASPPGEATGDVSGDLAGAPVDDASDSDDGAGARTWGIQPVPAAGVDARQAFVYDLEPGASIRDSVRVTNYGEAPLELQVTVHDAFNTTDGGFDVLPAASTSLDLGTWIVLDAPSVVVPGGGHVDVPFEMTVPSNASPGDHAGGIVASLTAVADDGSGRDVLVDHRVGARIYTRVDGPIRPAVAVTELDARYSGTGLLAASGTVVVDYVVRNAGNVRITAGQRMTVTGPFGLTTRTVALDELPELLPGGVYRGRAEVDAVRPMLRATTTLDLDWSVVSTPGTADTAGDVESASTTTWTFPWRLMLLAAVAAAMTYRRYRRRRRASAAGTTAAETADAAAESTPETAAESPPAQTTPATAVQTTTVRSFGLVAVVLAAVAGVGAPGASAVPGSDVPGGPESAEHAGAVTVQSVAVDPPVVSVSDEVSVELAGWPAGVAVVELCGNAARRGSADCDVAGSTAALVTDGVASVVLRVGRPPAACPCVVRVHQQGTGASTAAPLTISDLAVPVASGGSSAGSAPWNVERRLDIVEAVVHRDETWGALLGVSPGRRATIVVANTGTARIADAVVDVRLTGSISDPVVVPSPDLISLEPGEQREIDIAFALPTPAIGSYHLDVRLHGGDQVVQRSTATSHTPWGLLNGTVVVVATAFTVRRRRHLDQP